MCGETAAALLSCVLCLNARALILIHRTFMCILHIFSCTTVSRCARAFEVEPPASSVDGPDPCALYTESLASTVSRYPNVACAREALGLYMPSARADAFTTGRGTHDPCEAGSCATASYCLSGVAHDNCLPHRRAHCAHVAQHSSRPAQRRRRRTCEGGACMRWYGIGDWDCMRVMCCVRVRT